VPSGLRDKLAGPAPRMQSRSAIAKAAVPKPSLPIARRDSNSNLQGIATAPSAPSVRPAVVQPNAQPQIAPTLPSAPNPNSFAATEPGSSVRLLEMFQRLQDLGATKFRLERSEQDGGRYYFQCLLDGVSQPIMATDTDAVRTTERVVRQVEEYRATRLR
jgi:hypothetical protein